MTIHLTALGRVQRRLIVPVSYAIALTYLTTLFLRDYRFVTHRQNESTYRVTTYRILQRISFRRRFCIGSSMPRVLLSCIYRRYLDTVGRF